MESYRVLIKTSAARELEGVGRKGDRQRVVRRIAALAGQPRPHGSQKLAGAEDRYRVRQGRYRVVYTVNDAERTVVVFKIGDREEADAEMAEAARWYERNRRVADPWD